MQRLEVSGAVRPLCTATIVAVRRQMVNTVKDIECVAEKWFRTGIAGGLLQTRNENSVLIFNWREISEPDKLI
jgi:hypothetical protein